MENYILKPVNEEELERQLRETIRKIEETPLHKDRVLVVYLPDCHESLAGIIAGRIRERYYRPCFVLTDGEEGIKGSGRSIPGYHMFDEMTKVRECFTRYGGHPMAAGLSMERGRQEEFARAINRVCTLTEEELTPKLSYDAVLPLSYAGEQLLSELELLEPFGKGNEKPVFAAAGLKASSARIIGKNANVLKLVLETKEGLRMDAVSFGDVKAELSYLESREEISVLYYPEWNEYQGRRSVQLVIQGIR